MTKSITRAEKKLFYALGALLIAAVWQIAASVVSNRLLLPSPYETAVRLAGLLCDGNTYLCIFNTLWRVTAGIAAGTAAALILAVPAGISLRAGAVISPAEHVIRATPVASFIILALVWVKSGMISILISALIVFPVIYSGTVAALQSADRNLAETAQTDGAGRFTVFRVVEVPHAFPFFLSSLGTSIGLGWKAGIAAEVLCTPKNTVGRMLYDSKVYLETESLFAWTAIVILLSILTEWGVSLIRRFAAKKISFLSVTGENIAE